MEGLVHVEVEWLATKAEPTEQESTGAEQAELEPTRAEQGAPTAEQMG